MRRPTAQRLPLVPLILGIARIISLQSCRCCRRSTDCFSGWGYFSYVRSFCDHYSIFATAMLSAVLFVTIFFRCATLVLTSPISTWTAISLRTVIIWVVIIVRLGLVIVISVVSIWRIVSIVLTIASRTECDVLGTTFSNSRFSVRLMLNCFHYSTAEIFQLGTYYCRYVIASQSIVSFHLYHGHVRCWRVRFSILDDFSIHRSA